MSKHTPGPWVVDAGWGPSPEHPEWAAIKIGDSDKTVSGHIGAANARLIAAAPQLVEALDSLIGWAVMRSDWAAAGKSEPTDHPIQRARAALKAAGVES